MAAAEAAELCRVLAEAKRALRPHLDAPGNLPFEVAACSALQQVLQECQDIAHYATDRLSKLSMPLCVERLSGDHFNIEVQPASETVAVLKRRLLLESGIAGKKLDLVPRGMLACMRNADLLACYDLTPGVVMVVGDCGAELHLVWDVANSRWIDGQGTWDLLAVAEPRASGDGSLLCRGGTLDQLLITRAGVPQSPSFAGISVDITGWSCSFFTRAPRAADNGGYYCRTLLGARPDISHIVMSALRIGTYVDEIHRETDFDMSTLQRGWHHVCVVADPVTRQQEFFIDGLSVGALAAVLTPIYKIGNSSDGPQSWACPIHDFQLFLRVLSPQELSTFMYPNEYLPGDMKCMNKIGTL
jgi:hypothetical protein